jgi:hypothetical protein
VSDELTRGIPYVEGRHYTVEATSGCWEWKGNTIRGYANASAGRPHRLMYIAMVGPIPLEHDLHHICRNRLCINPAHMEPRERRRHRAEHQREDSPITGEQVVELRRQAATGVPLVRLAEQYGMHPSSVKDIVWGYRWAEVGGPIGCPPLTCTYCGAAMTGMRHKRYCDKTCRNRAQAARRKAQRNG